MAKRSGRYKRYLENDTEIIPRRTKFRWNAKNYNENGPRNTGGDSNTSNSENEKMGNEHFEKDIQEPLDIEDDGVNTEDDMVNASSCEVDNENSTTSLMGTDIQENNIEDDMSNASNSEDDDGAVDNENSSTSSLFGADIQEYEEDLSDSEGSMLHATRSEAGNDGDSENMMEDNTGGGSTSEFSVDNEDRADAGDKPLYPGARLSKGESILMLMSYLLRHNLTGEAFTHLLEMFNIMFPGLIPSSHYLFHKEFVRSRSVPLVDTRGGRSASHSADSGACTDRSRLTPSAPTRGSQARETPLIATRGRARGSSTRGSRTTKPKPPSRNQQQRGTPG
ncbi:uncharacterized protein LOC134322968 [Trichomycterus rosablanca]|uniref:uncharacterized protein LOC134322968 n=1 Tax=Trichomycterus rosablanca TaxID=2290929 RepID=UPI002F36096F